MPNNGAAAADAREGSGTGYKFLVDANVALDLLQNREPFVFDALQLFAMSERGEFGLLLPADAISTVFYVVEKNSGTAAGKEAIAKLLDFVTLAPLDEQAVLDGLRLDFKDVEDSLVAAVAQRCGAKAILARNAKDFANSPIPAITPKEFLASWEAKRAASTR